MLLESTIVFLVIMLMVFGLAIRQFSERFYNVSLRPTEIDMKTGDLIDPMKETPLIKITALKTRRFPFVVENVKNWYSTQPLVPSILGTDTGKQCPGVC